MKWVNDTTGRFKQRPHYTRNELDVECERALMEFYRSNGRSIETPISTQDLTVFIEQHTHDFDSCTDLSHEGDDVEGVTYFVCGGKPSVCISDKLGSAAHHNRLRTTLTHELFHVLFHDFLFQTSQPNLFDAQRDTTAKCKRDNILGATQYDWMEWQAGYGCGALLMPITALAEEVRFLRIASGDVFSTISVQSLEGQNLIATVATRFSTSRDAARVRLLQQSVLH